MKREFPDDDDVSPPPPRKYAGLASNLPSPNRIDADRELDSAEMRLLQASDPDAPPSHWDKLPLDLKLSLYEPMMKKRHKKRMQAVCEEILTLPIFLWAGFAGLTENQVGQR